MYLLKLVTGGKIKKNCGKILFKAICFSKTGKARSSRIYFAYHLVFSNWILLKVPSKPP